MIWIYAYFHSACESEILDAVVLTTWLEIGNVLLYDHNSIGQRLMSSWFIVTINLCIKTSFKILTVPQWYRGYICELVVRRTQRGDDLNKV